MINRLSNYYTPFYENSHRFFLLWKSNLRYIKLVKSVLLCLFHMKWNTIDIMSQSLQWWWTSYMIRIRKCDAHVLSSELCNRFHCPSNQLHFYAHEVVPSSWKQFISNWRYMRINLHHFINHIILITTQNHFVILWWRINSKKQQDILKCFVGYEYFEGDKFASNSCLQSI